MHIDYLNRITDKVNLKGISFNYKLLISFFTVFCLFGLLFATTNITLDYPDNFKYIDDQTPEFSFTPIGDYLKYNATLKIDGVNRGTSEVNNNTLSNITCNITLTSESIYNYSIELKNGGVSVSNSSVRYFTLDITSPVVTINSPTNGQYFNYYNPYLNFTYSETYPEKVYFQIDGEPINYTTNAYLLDNHTVLYLPMNEGVGNMTYDKSQYSNNGVMHGASFNEKDGLKFDGDNDYINCGNDNSLNIINELTLEAWIKQDQLANDDAYIGKWGANDATAQYLLKFESDDNSLKFAVNDGSNYYLITSGVNTIKIDKWYHVIGIFNGTHILSYLNGIQKGTPVIANPSHSTLSDLFIGNSYLNNDKLDGTITGVRIYNRSLSSTEVTEHYEGNYNNETGLVLNIPFTDKSGTNAEDKSGEGNNGTLSNFENTTAGYGDTHDSGWTTLGKPVFGRLGRGIYFNGISDYINCGNFLNVGTGDFAYSVWFRLQTNSTSDNSVIQKKYDIGSSGAGFALFVSSSNQLKVNYANDYVVLSDFTPYLNKFVNVVFVREGLQAKTYLNNVLISNLTRTNNITFGDTISIGGGRKNIGTREFKGTIDEVKIFNKALSEEEVGEEYYRGLKTHYVKLSDRGYPDIDNSTMLLMTFDQTGLTNGSADGETIYDLSGNNNDGTISGCNYSIGKFGGAMSFDGVNDLVSVPDKACLDITEAITIEAWIYPTGWGEDNQGRIVDKNYGTGYSFLIQNKIASKAVQFGSSNVDIIQKSNSNAVELNKWQHVVVTYDKANVKFYVNGIYKGGGAETASLGTNNDPIYIGNRAGQDRSFDGKIDQVEIYNRALSEEEIKYKYKLSNGIHNITVHVEDLAGNLGSDVNSFTIDTTYPLINFTNPTESNNITINHNWAEVNLTIDMNECLDMNKSLDTFIFNWDNINYTFYDDSLVLAMNFNNNSDIGEDSTHAVDISKYGNNGTISGAIWTTEGKFGGAMSFDANWDGVRDSGFDRNLINGKDVTFSVWVYQKGKGDAGAGNGYVYSSGNGWDDHLYYLYCYSDGCTFQNRKSAINCLSGDNDAITFTSSYVMDGWYHLAFTINSTNHSIFYVNGNAVNTTECSHGLYDSENGYHIGSRENGNEEFNGYIDELKIYNRVLSEDEIYMNYQSEFQKYNSTQYRFYNNITNLNGGEYTYYGWANDTAGNENQTEIRTLTIPLVNISYFSSTPSDNASGSKAVIVANLSIINLSHLVFNIDGETYNLSYNELLPFYTGTTTNDVINITYGQRPVITKYDLIIPQEHQLYPNYEDNLKVSLSFENSSSVGENYNNLGSSRNYNNYNVKDYSKYNHWARTDGGPLLTSGKSGNALSLYGSDDIVFIDNNGNLNGKYNFTLMFWVNLKAVPSSYDWLMTDYATGYTLYYYNTESLKFSLNGATTIGTTSVGNWHFITITMNSSDYAKLYLDSSNTWSGTKTGRYDNTGTITIGNKGTYNDADVIIDEFRIFDRVLSQEEINRYYNLTMHKTTGEYSVYLNYYDLNGSHNYSICAYDFSGSYKCTESRDFNMNATGDINITYPLTMNYSDTYELNINTTYSSDNLKNCWYNMNDEYNYSLSNCNYRLMRAIPEGQNNATVYLVDYGGNTFTDIVYFNTTLPVPTESLDFARVAGYYFVKGTSNDSYLPNGGNLQTMYLASATDSNRNRTVYDAPSSMNMLRLAFTYGYESVIPGNFITDDLSSTNLFYDKMIYYASLANKTLMMVPMDWWYDGTEFYERGEMYKNDEIQKKQKIKLRQQILRYNNLTNKLYRNDPSIFAWEVINEGWRQDKDATEVQNMKAWAKTMTDYVYSIDPYHLRSGSFEATTSAYYNEAPNASFVTFHTYSGGLDPGGGGFVGNYIQTYNISKPIIIGETGISEGYSTKTISTRWYLENRLYSNLVGGGAGIQLWGWSNETGYSWSTYTVHKNVMGLYRDAYSIYNKTQGSFEKSLNNIVQCNDESETNLLCNYHGKDTGEYGKLFVYNPYYLTRINDNTGFEYENLKGWTYNNSYFESTTEDYKFGYRSLKVNATDSGTKCNTTITSLSTNTNYTLTFWGKGTVATRIKLRTTSDVNLENITLTTNNIWEKYSFSINSSNNTEIVLDIIDEGTGNSYIDDFRFFRTDNVTTVNITSDNLTQAKDIYSDRIIFNSKDNYLLSIDPHELFVLEMSEGIPPQINFTNPTDSNNDIVNRNHTYINTSISDDSNTTAFIDFNRSLKLWLRFDNSSDLIDHSTYSNDGTNSGSTYTIDGKFGSGRNFDGSNDYINCGNDDSLNLVEAITIEAWFNTPLTGDIPSGYHAIVSKDDHKWMFGYEGWGNYIGFWLRNSTGSDKTARTTILPSPNTWHYAVGTYDGNKIKFYLDGNLIAQNDMTGDIITTTQPVQIGHNRWSRYFNGTIDEVRIHNRALSLEEINASYNAGLHRLYHNFTDLADGTYNYTAYVQDLSGNLNQTETRTITMDTTPPQITWTQQPDLNLTDESNPTYLINVSDTGIVNATTFIFYHGLNCTECDTTQLQYRYPASSKQPQELRNCNRNESIDLIENNAIKYDGADDIWSYGGHLYGTNSIPTIDSQAGDNSWILFNITHDYHHLMSYHIPVDRTLLHSEDKTTQFVSIYKNRPAMVELNTFPTHINRTIHIEMNIDDQSATNPLKLYICNSSATPYTEDYTTSSNCGYWGSRTDFDTKDATPGNSSYVYFHTGIDNNTLLQVNGGITPTERLYIYLETSEPTAGKAYKLYFANDSTPSDLANFNETYLLHTYTPSSWTNRSETPDVQFQVSGDDYDILLYVHVCDNLTNCVNDTVQIDSLGDRPNEAPTTPLLTAPLANYNISFAYNITWVCGIDPEGDPQNITIYLVNESDSTETILVNNNVSCSDEIWTWDDSTKDANYWSIKIRSCDDSNACSLNTTSMGNFTINNTVVLFSNPRPLLDEQFDSTTTAVTIGVTTDTVANCRYSTISGTNYANMTNFTNTNSTIHSSLISVSFGNTYNYYIKCNNSIGNINPTDYRLYFAVKASDPGGGGGSGGDIPDDVDIICGDGICQYEENATNCPEDCNVTAIFNESICGDGICEGNEDYKNCPQDCISIDIPDINYPDFLGKIQLWLENKYIFPNGTNIYYWHVVILTIIIFSLIWLMYDYSILKNLIKKYK